MKIFFLFPGGGGLGFLKGGRRICLFLIRNPTKKGTAFRNCIADFTARNCDNWFIRDPNGMYHGIRQLMIFFVKIIFVPSELSFLFNPYRSGSIFHVIDWEGMDHIIPLILSSFFYRETNIFVLVVHVHL